VDEGPRSPGGIIALQPCLGIAEPPQQLLELVAAAVEIADHVTRTLFLTPVVPEGHAFDGGTVHLLGGLHDEDVPEALLAQPP